MKDNSGWTPYIHAAFRGLSHSKIKDFLRPKTTLEKPNPPSQINSNSNESGFTYGHGYLQDQSMILITLGNTDSRKCVDPVELYDTPSTSISLVVDANVTGEPVIVDL